MFGGEDELQSEKCLLYHPEESREGLSGKRIRGYHQDQSGPFSDAGHRPVSEG